MDECSAMPLGVETKTLVFDRPFAVVLRDTTTRAIIFDGVVYEP
jgi:serine protease inhibitor